MWGAEFLAQGDGFEVARRIARWHHETIDGSGYPDGLREERILHTPAGPSLTTPLGLASTTGLADILATEFMVVTYDRCGYSRSPRPASWSTTSIEAQADDAGALLSAVGVVPTAVFGSSTGALIALELAIRHAHHLRGVVIHEPTIFGVLPPAYVQEQFAGVTPVIEEAMMAGGPRAAQRTLLGLLAGEGGFDGLASDEMRERWLTNAELVFGMEFPSILMAYRPSSSAIASIPVPIQVLRAESTPPINVAADEWLAARTGTTLLECPGAHLAYINQPSEVAATIRPFLARVSQ